MNENSEDNPASQQLAECIAFLEQCIANFNFASSRLSLCDKARNDLLHSLELYDNDATARARTAAKLKMCLLERRIYKDMVESYAPIVTVLHGKKIRQPDSYAVLCLGADGKGGAKSSEPQVSSPGFGHGDS